MNSQAEFYKWFAPAYEALYKVIDAGETVRQWHSLLQTVRPNGQHNSRRRLLDVGCGPGWHLPHWHRRGLTVAGLDVSMAMLEFAKTEWLKEEGGEPPPLYCADLLRLAGGILTAQPFDILVLHSNLLHLFSPEQLPSLFAAMALLATPGALMMADSSSTSLLRESSRDTIEIAGVPWEQVSRFDPAQGVLEQIWTSDATTMTELCWPVKTQEYDKIAAEVGWTVRSRVPWNPQDSQAPFRGEWGNQTRCVTIYGRTGKS
jgi:SAM-dependent methyltransferase